MGSTRLPGKVVAELGGRPLIAFMLHRLRELAVDSLVVATSDDPRDDVVAAVAADAGARVVRGPEEDVLARFILAVDTYPADVVVRLTADCPLVDSALVQEAVELQRRTGADYASNTLVRTFPDGLDVEVLPASVLRVAGEEAVDRSEREHVTPFVYRRPERFLLKALTTPEGLGDERWTVDTPADLERVREIVGGLEGVPSFGWRDVLAVAPAHAATGAPRLVVDAAAPPGARRWTIVDGERSVGEISVAVQTGEGRLTMPTSDRRSSTAADTLQLLLSVLARDFQVTALWLPADEVTSGDRSDFEGAGFTLRPREGGDVLWWSGTKAARGSSGLELRLVTAQDRRLLWEWANDPVTRAESFSTEPIEWETHVQWFDEMLADEHRVMYLALVGAEPVGQIRFDMAGSRATVSISIAPEQRGRGLGRQFLVTATRKFLAEFGGTVDAFIRASNERSARAFLAAGYRLAAHPSGAGPDVLRLVASEAPSPED